MQIRWLGWAGMEIEADGLRLVVDPLRDASAVFAFLGERAAAIPAPEVVAAEGDAVAGLVTHLHRDHADAAALGAATTATLQLVNSARARINDASSGSCRDPAAS
jgi:L-ascorbate metabolism protein UlaG (beta-lactamase superfamily)